MIIYVTLDDNRGMMFNNRRQSQDKKLREHLLNECKENKLWMNEYTARQFGKLLPENVVVDDEFLDKAARMDCCFIENRLLSTYLDKIEKIIIFKWNRVYPADMYFDIAMDNWKLVRVEEFTGSSHELISREEWIHED